MNKMLEKIRELIDRFRALIYLIGQEKIHRYFLLLVLLILVFAALFFIIEYDSISTAAGLEEDVGPFSKIIAAIYWSIITASTTGYGDILPQTDGGRVLITLMLFFTIVAVSLFTANLASALTTHKLLEGRGIMNLAKIRDHYVICGWKKNMGKFLEEIVKYNPGINLKKITVIAHIEVDEIEIFRQNYPQFKEVIILRGDHYNESLLRKSNVEHAAKVLILADDEHSQGGAGIDSITVMTAIAVRSISNDVVISAELTDDKFEKYLQTAHVDEIVYTNEYSNALMANSMLQVGLTKVINDLLIHHGSADLKIAEIPEEYHDKPFNELCRYFKEQKNGLLIGLLENVGRFAERRQEAIRSAQKTEDVQILVDNLKSAWKMESNQSHILPDDDYQVPNNSLAILIERGKK